jgi:hypothetical protein
MATNVAHCMQRLKNYTDIFIRKHLLVRFGGVLVGFHLFLLSLLLAEILTC